MLNQVSFNLTSIISSLAIITRTGDYVEIPASSLGFSNNLNPIYPFCYTLDLNSYFNIKKQTPLGIYFYFKIINNVEVSLYIEDKHMQLKKRTLKSNMLSYVGPQIKIDDLKNPALIKVMISMQQFIDSEDDTSKRCINYPNERFKSYQDCDEEYVYNFIKEKYKMVPFWTTNNMSEVTTNR